MTYKKGMVLKRKGPSGLYIHYGIVTGRNKVTHNSKEYGQVVEKSISEFAMGKQVQVCTDIVSTNPNFAAKRAKALVGKPYGLLSFNCEHLVRHAHSDPRPGQAEQYKVILILAILISVMKNNRARDTLKNLFLLLCFSVGLRTAYNNIV